jgi:hypothetical protein
MSVFRTTTPALLAALLTACGGDDSSSSERASDSATAATIQRPPIQAQNVFSLCDLLPAADVEQVLGKLAAPPHRARNAENTEEDEDGFTCVLPIHGKNGAVVEVGVQVDPTGSAAAEQASNMLDGMFTRELSDGASPAPKAAAPRTDGWDFVGGVPDMRIWRVGHVAIGIGGRGNFLLPKQAMHQLAALVRDRIPDLPFAAPGADPNRPGPQPDPCTLLTRAEAETVLGQLAVEPFRSNETTALADGEGPSCTYYTRGHRTLVITPTYTDGKMMFGMMSGTSRLIRSTVGGADGADAIDGPWDQAGEGSTGTLFFLKGDEMLEVAYRMSATDVAGAARLARVAIARL